MALSQEGLHDDVSYQTIAVMVVSMVLVNCAVLLRLIARKKMKLPLLADDYMILLAAVCEAFLVPHLRNVLTDHSSLSMETR